MKISLQETRERRFTGKSCTGSLCAGIYCFPAEGKKTTDLSSRFAAALVAFERNLWMPTRFGHDQFLLLLLPSSFPTNG